MMQVYIFTVYLQYMFNLHILNLHNVLLPSLAIFSRDNEIVLDLM